MAHILDPDTAILHELSWLEGVSLDALVAHLPAYSRIELAEAVMRLHRAGMLAPRRRKLLHYHEAVRAPLALVS